MTDHFNKLTPAETERLSILAEECAEVIQIVGKILRHGYESHHPNDRHRRTNRQLLSAEILDVSTIIWQMKRDRASDFSVADMGNNWMQKLRYTHHQEQ